MATTNARDSSWGPPEIDPSEITLEEKIGSGSFGKVYKGKCRQKPVAIKILQKQFDKKTIASFRREVEIISKIFHPNICLFMGASTGGKNLMIVTEYLPRGDLEKLLHDPKVQLSLYTRMKMARDAALGMNWLHCSNPMLIHRDLKSSNLLVDENLNVKVCDFGLSQLLPHDQVLRDTTNAKGTPLWMAPEVMMFKEFNEKCDVYSFGVVLWEIVTRQEPFAHHTSFDKFKEAVCILHERPPIPPDCIPSLKKLMEACWHPDPAHRPSFDEILNQLDFILIDAAISDSVGNAFWKKYFLKEEKVPWKNALSSLNEYIRIPDNSEKELNINCLHAVLAEKNKESEEVVHVENFGRVCNWFGPLEQPIPSQNSIFDRLRNLLKKTWFHGDISAEEAQNRLHGLQPGSFLVRFSTTHPGTFTISSLALDNNKSLKHQRVVYVQGEGFHFNGQVYKSLEEVIRSTDDLLIGCVGSKYQPLFSGPKPVVIGYK
jgi:serine/threonine protein kinase